MATVTHYIRSYYNPEDREALERETAQKSEEPEHENQAVQIIDPEEEWRREASRIPVQRPRRIPPQFVPATVSYDEWISAASNHFKTFPSASDAVASELAGWYRGLTSKHTEPRFLNVENEDLKPFSPTLIHSAKQSTCPAPKKLDSRNKNNWFIMNAIQSEPLSESSSSSSTSAQTLADILAREPPPLPSQSKFTPPVWLEIGPSNKGFGMLQRSGWNEGEPLGPDVIRRKPVQDLLPDEDIISVKGKGENRSNHLPSETHHSRREVMEVRMEQFDGVSELRNVDVIDLTLSDSDEDDRESIPDSDDDPVKHEEESTPGEINPPFSNDRMDEDVSSPYRRKALLTPIATVLKSDKLGIGLKAKTEGIHKASKKRVTHSQAALAAHVKAAEESRTRRKQFGRGRRGFEKQQRREEEKRKAMLAYLKGL